MEQFCYRCDAGGGDIDVAFCNQPVAGMRDTNYNPYMKKNRPSHWFLFVLALCVTTRSAAQFSSVSLPSGLQPTESEMVVYQHSLYLVLQNAAHTSYSLYRYNGSTFTAIALPANYRLFADTHFEVLNGSLYFMPDHVPGDTTAAELMRYDGATVTPIDIPNNLIPKDSMRLSGHRPFVFENKLYVEVVRLDSIRLDPFTVTYWVKYDGSSFSRMKVPVRFTCQVAYTAPIPSDKKVFQGKLFARYKDFVTDQYQPIRYNGSVVDVDTSHPSYIARPGGCEMEIYNGYLYIPTYTSGPGTPYGGKLNRYDGITQTAVTIPAALRYANTTLEVYNGKLWGAMYDGAAVPQWYSYNGTTFSLKPLPAGTAIHPPGDQRIFNCKLYITLLTGTSGGLPVYGLYTYTEAAACAASVLPEAFGRFERIDIRAYGPERDWCWTGIDIDWTFPTPCELPDCTDPVFAASLLEKPGAVVWSKTFDKPFQALFPADDKQPFITTVGMLQGKTFEDVLIFDKELVPAGLESIGLEMKPQSRQFQLTATADNGKKVPFIMALLDANGKTIWQETYTAPLSTSVKAEVKEPGVSLRFMAVPNLLPKGAARVSVFPNPATPAAATAIDIDTPGSPQPARLTITNFYGKVIYQADVMAPAVHYPTLANATPGLYVVTVTLRSTEYRSVLMIK